MEKGKYTYNEIISQPEAWQQALEVVKAQRSNLGRLTGGEYCQTVFTGCGSTYYLSIAASALYQELTGKPARAVPGGEMLLNPRNALTDGKTLLVAISRSGSTTETVRAVEVFKREGRGDVIVITNYGDQPLAKLADLAFVIEKGQEQSVAQTRSFASMYVAATAICTIAARRDDLSEGMARLPEIGSSLIKKYQAAARDWGENLAIDRFYFLGSGTRYGLACEVNLKMKEMTLTHSEPFHFLEFRHGPMSMVTDSTVIVGLVSEKNNDYEMAVLNEMKTKGGQILSLAENTTEVAFHSSAPESIRGVLYLPVLQLLAYFRSLAKGLNPDRPANLTAVVKLNL